MYIAIIQCMHVDYIAIIQCMHVDYIIASHAVHAYRLHRCNSSFSYWTCVGAWMQWKQTVSLIHWKRQKWPPYES